MRRREEEGGGRGASFWQEKEKTHSLALSTSISSPKKTLLQAFALVGGAMIFGFTLYFARVKSLMFIPKARAM